MRTRKVWMAAASALVLFATCDRSSADSPQTAVNAALFQLPPGCNVATSLPPQCRTTKGAIIFACETPIYWEQGDASPKFSYAFQYQPATAGDTTTAPLAIVLPGGAGAPSIGLGSGAIFPPTFRVIYTDVRGAGCNINPDRPFTADGLTTEYFARDVLSIVQKFGIPEYVLYGISYGTVQATVMANIAQKEGIQTPRALILEGILGNWWIRAQDVVDYNKEWTKVKAVLPSSVVTEFQSPSPYGISSADWMVFLVKTLNDGATPAHGGNTTVYYLRPLDDPQTRPQAIATIQDLIIQIKTGITPELARVASILHCTETAGSIYTKDLVNGQIVNTGSNLCTQYGLDFVRPYDSAQYPVSVPIYYFEGSEDPDTSPANALYHFNNQTQADRVFTMVWAAGHTDLSQTLYQAQCSAAILTAIATNPAGVGAALTACTWPLTFGARPAGQ